MFDSAIFGNSMPIWSDVGVTKFMSKDPNSGSILNCTFNKKILKSRVPFLGVIRKVKLVYVKIIAYFIQLEYLTRAIDKILGFF